MALPSNASTSLGELARLADEILYLAGDISVDFSWYTKRATISAIYSSTELYMTSDNSPEFVETEQFLDRRLEESRAMGIAVAAIGEWTKFTAQATMNVARSKGVSI
jgi:ubiquinone biosynthesis protein COQ9